MWSDLFKSQRPPDTQKKAGKNSTTPQAILTTKVNSSEDTRRSILDVERRTIILRRLRAETTTIMVIKDVYQQAETILGRKPATPAEIIAHVTRDELDRRRFYLTFATVNIKTMFQLKGFHIGDINIKATQGDFQGVILHPPYFLTREEMRKLVAPYGQVVSDKFTETEGVRTGAYHFELQMYAGKRVPNVINLDGEPILITDKSDRKQCTWCNNYGHLQRHCLKRRHHQTARLEQQAVRELQEQCARSASADEQNVTPSLEGEQDAVGAHHGASQVAAKKDAVGEYSGTPQAPTKDAVRGQYASEGADNKSGDEEDMDTEDEEQDEEEQQKEERREDQTQLPPPSPQPTQTTPPPDDTPPLSPEEAQAKRKAIIEKFREQNKPKEDPIYVVEIHPGDPATHTSTPIAPQKYDEMEEFKQQTRRSAGYTAMQKWGTKENLNRKQQEEWDKHLQSTVSNAFSDNYTQDQIKNYVTEMKYRDGPPTTAEMQEWMARKNPIWQYWYSQFRFIHSQGLPEETTKEQDEQLHETVEDATQQAVMDALRKIFGRRFNLLYETIERRDQ